MLDYLHIPKQQNGNIDYFSGFSNTSTTPISWEVWNKPRGISFIKIICIGGGAGGAGGVTSPSTTARSGGGGGGSGGSSTVMTPAIFLPDRLYVSVGIGGSGGVSNGSGNNGIPSYVAILPTQSVSGNYLVSSSLSGFGAVVSSGGAAAGITTIGDCMYAGQGNFTALQGQVGGGGGAATGAIGTSIVYPTTGILLSGGAGGAGGAGFAGGNITAPASQTSTYTLFPTLPGGIAGTAGSLAGGDGTAGVNNMQLLLFTGGSGGGSGFDGTAGSVGGRGGAGGIGCGGGGGGAGTTGGRGGNGGSGLVIISCW